MIETAIALLFGHVLGDFLLQTRWMVDHKRRPAVLALHVGIVMACTVAALGGGWAVAAAVAAAHLAIDAVKTHALPDRLASFMADQGAHLATIAAAAWLWPETVDHGLWAAAPAALPIAQTLLTGLIVATLAGGPAIGLLMARFDDTGLPPGLPQAGRLIGLLERSMIFILVLAGQPAGIGFLIAAKSVLRFDTASKDQEASEYVIIGTLASFGWAMTAAFATLHIMETLEKLPATP